MSDREMDALLATRLFDWNKEEFDKHHPPGLWEKFVEPYTTNLDACFRAQAECVRKVGWPAYEVELLNGETDAEKALELFATADARTRCAAMLRALEVEG